MSTNNVNGIPVFPTIHQRAKTLHCNNIIFWWHKSVIKESENTIHNYSSQSPRAAASFYVKSHGVSLATINQSAG